MRAISLALLLPQVAAQSNWAPVYEPVGNGYCQDSVGEYFEGWYALGWDLGRLLTDEDDGDCDCEECETLCNQHEDCVGYQFYCCPIGVRCFGGASVLFNYNTRPVDDPPAPFGYGGPKGSATVGKRFKGTGDISQVHEAKGAYCYKKPAVDAPTEVV